MRESQRKRTVLFAKILESLIPLRERWKNGSSQAYMGTPSIRISCIPRMASVLTELGVLTAPWVTKTRSPKPRDSDILMNVCMYMHSHACT